MSLNILALAILVACGNSNSTDNVESLPEISPQMEIVIDVDAEEHETQSMIVGKFTKEDLLKSPFAEWFEKGYDDYQPKAEALETIKNNISEYEIVGFIGTWCPDSRRELPKMFKILDQVGYDLSKLTMVGVTRGKSTPENIEEGYNMHRVPTFIFLKDGKEVNRFVEYEIETIEEDIAKIVTGEDYKNPYSN